MLIGIGALINNNTFEGAFWISADVTCYMDIPILHFVPEQNGNKVASDSWFSRPAQQSEKLSEG